MNMLKRCVVAALVVIGACIPDDTSKPGWGLFPGQAGSNDTGSSPGVVVVGDSLVFNLDVQTVANAIRFFRGTDSFVALGSNDARIITGERGQSDGYTVDEFAQQAQIAVSSGLSHSQCVVLVNVANHWDVAAPDVVDRINTELGNLGSGDPRVRTVDWNSFSAPHPEWFVSPTDIHHSEVGKTAYRDFINDAVAAAMSAGC